MKLAFIYILIFLILIGCSSEEQVKPFKTSHLSTSNPYLNGILKSNISAIFLEHHKLVTSSNEEIDSVSGIHQNYCDTCYLWKFDEFGNLTYQHNFNTYYIVINDSLGFIDSSVFKDCMYYKESFIKTENPESKSIQLKSSNSRSLTPIIDYLFNDRGLLVEKVIRYHQNSSTKKGSTKYSYYPDGNVKEIIETEVLPKREIANFSASRRIWALYHLKQKNNDGQVNFPKLIRSHYEYKNSKLIKVTEYADDQVLTEIFLNESELIDSTITSVDSNRNIIEYFSYY